MARKLTRAQLPIVKAAILSKRQSGKCPLCDMPLTVTTGCVDHDHYTGIIRGVLCRNCNGIEGKIKNLVVRAKRGALPKDYLGKLLMYWIQHETDQTGLIYPLHLTDDEKRIKRNTKARKVRAVKKKVSV